MNYLTIDVIILTEDKTAAIILFKHISFFLEAKLFFKLFWRNYEFF